MPKNNTKHKVKKTLSKHLAVPAKEIKDGDSFAKDLNADPQDLSEAFEEIYAIFEIEEHRTNFDTVADLIEYVKDHIDELEA